MKTTVIKKRGAPRQLISPRRINVEIEATEYDAVEKVLASAGCRSMTDAVRRMFVFTANKPDILKAATSMRIR